MHPATKAHIYGMLEIIRQSTKSIEAALSASENIVTVNRAKEEIKANGNGHAPSEPAYLTEEEEELLGERMNSLLGRGELDG